MMTLELRKKTTQVAPVPFGGNTAGGGAGGTVLGMGQ